MNRHLLLLFLPVIYFFTFLSTIGICAGQNEDSLSQSLIKEWYFVSIKDILGNDVKEVSANDILSFAAESTTQRFSYSIEKESISASGVWELNDNLLILTYDLKPDTSEIDSASYVVMDGKPMIVYYNKGQEVTRIENDLLSSQRKAHFYNIIQLTPDSLVYIEKEIIYSFVHRAPEVVEDISDETGGEIFVQGVSLKLKRNIIGCMKSILAGLTFLFSY